MQVRVDWVLIIFATQVIIKKRSVRPVFPDYLSVSDDYGIRCILVALGQICIHFLYNLFFLYLFLKVRFTNQAMDG